MKKSYKIIVVISIICFLTMFINMSYGFGITDLTGVQPSDTTATLKNAGNSVIKVITTIGVVASVIILIVLGIKYMMGSTEEKAEYKKTLVPYTIGAGLVFAASTIAQIIYELAISS